MTRSRLWVSFLILISVKAEASLHRLVEARVKPEANVALLESERTWAVSGYNPIQFFEYRYGREFEDNQRYYKIPFKNEGGETHTIRIHFKSLQEISKFSDSREYSRKLLQIERAEAINQQQFDAYLELIEDILNARMLAVLEVREAELKRSIDHNGQALGLPDADVKDVVSEMVKLRKVGSDHSGIKAQTQASAKMSEKELIESAQTLVDNVGALARKVAEAIPRDESLQTERKRIELKLKRIDREISWAEDRKLVDHLDIQRDSLDRTDSIRIGFNIPFLRFDNETRARDKALLVASEHEADRQRREIASELRRTRAEVYSLAAQVESMRSRLAKTRSLTRKMKGVNDIELKSVLGEFGFELERDILIQALKFYNAYLELLRDTGSFARFSDFNLLDPKWQSFNR